MRPKPTARAEESLRFGHDLVPALRAMPGANPVPDTIRVPEVRQTQIAYKSYRTAIGAVVAPRRIAAPAQAIAAGPSAPPNVRLDVCSSPKADVDRVIRGFPIDRGLPDDANDNRRRLCRSTYNFRRGAGFHRAIGRAGGGLSETRSTGRGHRQSDLARRKGARRCR